MQVPISILVALCTWTLAVRTANAAATTRSSGPLTQGGAESELSSLFNRAQSLLLSGLQDNQKKSQPVIEDVIAQLKKGIDAGSQLLQKTRSFVLPPKALQPKRKDLNATKGAPATTAAKPEAEDAASLVALEVEESTERGNLPASVGNFQSSHIRSKPSKIHFLELLPKYNLSKAIAMENILAKFNASRPIAINGMVPKFNISKLLPWTSEYTGTYSDAYGTNDAKLAGYLNPNTVILKMLKFLENIRNQAESLIYEWIGLARPTPVEVPSKSRSAIKPSKLPPKTIVVEQPHQQKTILVEVSPGKTTIVDRPSTNVEPDGAEPAVGEAGTSQDADTKPEDTGSSTPIFGEPASQAEASSMLESILQPLVARSSSKSISPDSDALGKLLQLQNVVKSLTETKSGLPAPRVPVLDDFVTRLLGRSSEESETPKSDNTELLNAFASMLQ